MRRTLALALVASALVPAAALADADPLLPEVTAAFETAPLLDDADADDPAIWVHPGERSRSIVVGTAKNGGLRVYALDGRTLQSFATPPPPRDGDAAGRFNNVDIVTGVRLGLRVRDLALVSDRGRDQVRAYAIDPRGAAAAEPLTDVTAPGAPLVFSADQDEVNEQATAYGLTTWPGWWRGAPYVVVSRRSRTTIGLLRLLPARGGRVTYRLVDTTDLPKSFPVPGGTWTPCEDPGDDPQVEGMVADQRRSLLFAGQEDVGIWTVPLGPFGFGRAALIERVREFGAPAVFDEESEECVADPSRPDPGVGGEHISADVEGLTIADGPGRPGWLLASSQGDDTFAVFADRGLGAHVGSFAVGDGVVDGAQESDGAAVTTADLGGPFSRGLLVVQDGENTPEVLDDEGEPIDNTGFKLVSWGAVADALGLGR